jgi:hypothetical protein
MLKVFLDFTLFNPSSTTYVKHFIFQDRKAIAEQFYLKIFQQVTQIQLSAINAIQFKYNQVI